MIYQEVNFSSFCDAFFRMSQEDNFSYAGKQALFDYLEEMSEDTGENYELDIIALCCEWQELTPEEIVKQYDCIKEDLNLTYHFSILDEDEQKEIEIELDDVLQVLHGYTTARETDSGTIIFISF